MSAGTYVSKYLNDNYSVCTIVYHLTVDRTLEPNVLLDVGLDVLHDGVALTEDVEVGIVGLHVAVQPRQITVAFNVGRLLLEVKKRYVWDVLDGFWNLKQHIGSILIVQDTLSP